MERRIANFEIWTKKQGAEGASCSKCSMKFDRAIARNSHEKNARQILEWLLGR